MLGFLSFGLSLSEIVISYVMCLISCDEQSEELCHQCTQFNCL
jgi:hypothetical protein